MPGWEIGVSRNLSDYIHPYNVTTISRPNNLCSNDSSTPDLLIMVLSATSHFDARNTIRNTWIKNTSSAYSTHMSVRIIFILGQSKNETINVS